MASHRCFGPGWKTALKGAFAIAGSVVEAISIGAVSLLAYIGWLAYAYPDEVLETGVSVAEGLTVIFLFALICLVPFLLHAGVKAYYRLR